MWVRLPPRVQVLGLTHGAGRDCKSLARSFDSIQAHGRITGKAPGRFAKPFALVRACGSCPHSSAWKGSLRGRQPVLKTGKTTHKVEGSTPYSSAWAIGANGRRNELKPRTAQVRPLHGPLSYGAPASWRSAVNPRPKGEIEGRRPAPKGRRPNPTASTF